MGIGALLLAALYALPLWSIQLFAPQYPEGLGMTVRLSTITGARPSDLDTINELNHYIGMKPIEPGAVTELRYFPYIVGVLIVLGVAAALFGKRKLVVAWLTGVALFGAAGLADFWRWAYDYGHNIDTEHAIIKIPGMTYQPPIIGTKQLLNFTAASWPALGAYVALIAFALGVVALVLHRPATSVIVSSEETKDLHSTEIKKSRPFVAALLRVTGKGRSLVSATSHRMT
jgi:copper chaperone NosL